MINRRESVPECTIVGALRPVEFSSDLLAAESAAETGEDPLNDGRERGAGRQLDHSVREP